MASVWKNFLPSDIAQTRQLLHEAIPITGSIYSGTYGTQFAESNIKNYSHGMFEDVYDYAYLSSSANQLCNITVGYANSSALSSSTNTQNDKKINIYNQMAKVLMGTDETGSIVLFDEDGDILAGGRKIREAYFINFSRLLVKDEIKKGSFSMSLGTSTTFATANNTRVEINDLHAPNDYRVNSPAGEYAVLTCSNPIAGAANGGAVGLLFYQAGVVVLTASIFRDTDRDGFATTDCVMSPTAFIGGTTITASLTGAYISSSADFFRHRLYNVSFNNTTELNSTIYFCRLNHSDFNYSSNPTYLSGSKIRVKTNTYDEPCSYVCGIGLYSSDGELLGVAKLSECIKKSPSTECVIRCRIDY